MQKYLQHAKEFKKAFERYKSISSIQITVEKYLQDSKTSEVVKEFLKYKTIYSIQKIFYLICISKLSKYLKHFNKNLRSLSTEY